MLKLGDTADSHYLDAIPIMTNISAFTTA